MIKDIFNFIFLLIFIKCNLCYSFIEDGSGENNKVVKNIDILQNLSGEIVTDLFNILKIQSNEPLKLRVADYEGKWIIEHGITNRLLVQNYKVNMNSDIKEKTGYFVEIIPLNLEIKYSSTWRDGLFGHLKVNRSAKIELLLSVTSLINRDVIFSGISSKQFSDTVLVKDIPKLEHSNIKQTQGVIPDDSVLERFVEPIIILGGIGIIIYLFFHVRS